jgi:hypothetical protein
MAAAAITSTTPTINADATADLIRRPQRAGGHVVGNFTSLMIGHRLPRSGSGPALRPVAITAADDCCILLWW